MNRQSTRTLMRWATWRHWKRAFDLVPGERFFTYLGHEWTYLGALRAQLVSPSGSPMAGVYARLAEYQWCAVRLYPRVSG